MLGYAQMWDQARIDEGALAKARGRMAIAINNAAEYTSIQNSLGIPVLFVAPIHEREASLSYGKHLHNGDSLSARTVHVPAGRPLTGNPPFRWRDSAMDALLMRKLNTITNWSIERILYEQHKYNGITKYPSSYVFSGTQYYTSGMWVRDHVYDPSVIDHRPGTLVMMKALVALQPGLGNLSREPVPPKEVVDEHTKKSTKVSRVVRNAAGGATGASGGTEVATKPTATIFGLPALQVGVGVCIAVFVAAAVWVIVRKWQAKDEINTLWSGK